MTARIFRFSEAAKLYVENLEIMSQMREETYQSISDFADKVINALKNELGDDHLCQKNTYMAGAYYGAEVRYLWIGRDIKEWTKVSTILFIVPIPGQVINDVKHAKVLDIVRHNKITLHVEYKGLAKKTKEKIAALSANEELGELIRQNAEDFSIRISFDQSDPVASASKRIAKLLRAIKEAQKNDA